MKTVAIVGGGFGGTMAAVNLARFSKSPLKVVLINAGRPLRRGAAYGTVRPEHLLNVVARNMSALPDHPAHFIEWLRSRSDYADTPETHLRESFIPRRVYGDYLTCLSQNYLNPIDDHCPTRIDVVDDEVTDLLPDDDGSITVVLAAKGTERADQVVLATGNQPPAAVPWEGGVREHPAYCADPWTKWENRLPDPAEDVVLLGTGLTMVDAFLTLTTLGWSGTITAVSRNGLLPQSHFKGIEYPDYIADAPKPTTLAAAVRIVRRHVRSLHRLKQNPAIAVDKLRPHTQMLWQEFTADEKRTFLRRYATRWNVARHRIAESVHRALSEAVAGGRLRIARGSVESLEPQGERIAVRLRDSSGAESRLTGAFVLNCTGPRGGFSETGVPLFRNLLRRGLARPDELDLGIDVSEDFAVLDSTGIPSRSLFAMGPLLRGKLWETTAVPELRGQAMRIAQILLDHQTQFVIDDAVLEYCI